MTDEKKQQLFPYFAYMYSQQLDPEKYGNAGSIDEWSSLIQENQNDMSQITDAASQLTDEEWDNLEKEYSSESNSNENQDIAYAQKGAKLKQLKAASKGIAFEKGTTKSYARTEVMKHGGKKKKCECGCAVVTKKAKGGQLVDSCNCCGKVHDTQSFEQGGNILKAGLGRKIMSNPWTGTLALAGMEALALGTPFTAPAMAGLGALYSAYNNDNNNDNNDDKQKYVSDHGYGNFKPGLKTYKNAFPIGAQIKQHITDATAIPGAKFRTIETSNSFDSPGATGHKSYSTIIKNNVGRTSRIDFQSTLKNQKGNNTPPAKTGSNPATSTNVKPKVKNRVGATTSTTSRQTTQQSNVVDPSIQSVRDTDSAVRAKQAILVKAGLLDPKAGKGRKAVDGIWGKKTQEAWEKYEINKEVMAQIKNNANLPDIPESSQITGTAAQAFYKKGGLISKKQAGGDSTSASSQVGVAKCGGKVKDRIKKAQDGGKTKNVLPVTNHVIKPLVSLKKAKGGDYLK